MKSFKLAVAAVAVALLCGCGGDAGSDASGGGDITEAKLKAAADDADKVPAPE